MTPDRPNSFRKTIPISYKGEEPQTLYAIGFIRGDGTGNENEGYNIKQITNVDSSLILKKDDLLPKHVPRKKKCDMEVFFPFFTVKKNGTAVAYAAYLQELGLENGKLAHLCDLGMTEKEFLDRLNNGTTYENCRLFHPRALFTTAYTRHGEKKGDPHAIWLPDKEEFEGLVQVVGFLIPGKEMYEFFDRKAEMPLFRQ